MLNQRRGKNVALAGAALQFAFTGVMLTIWLWTGSLTARSTTWLLAGGVAVWLVAAFLFYTRQLERREQMELEELAARPGGGIFEGAEADQLRPAALRRAWTDRWIVPIFTLLLAAYQAAIGLVLLLLYLPAADAPAVANADQAIVFLVLIGFLAFLFGRYAVGMSAAADWRGLRAPASYLLGNVLMILVAIASLAAATQDALRADLYLAYVAPVVQVVLAAELVLNLILDLYRPRVPGEEPRVSYDSRLLNIVAESGKLGHSIAAALNYQFGFEVSKTWFYRLLQRSLVPLLFAGAVVLLLMSSVVVVRDGEAYVVKRWGRLDYSRRPLGPGIHLKWFWPVETARRFEVGRVHQLMLGAGEERSEEERKRAFVKGREIYLWTEEHGRREELDFLVAVPPETRREAEEAAQAAEEGAEKKPPPVSVIKLVVAMDYVIRDPYRFGYDFVDADKLLECVAYREMVRYCASATLTERITHGGADRPQAIMTFGRAAAAKRLKERIQRRADALGLGVEITYAGLISTHPPAEAAPKYEEVLMAERAQDEKRYQAEAEANEMLALVAGDPTSALRLAQAIRWVGQLQELKDRKVGSEEFRARLAEHIAKTRDDIRMLEKEIAREVLLGQEKGRKAVDKRRLKARYADQLDVLERIRSAPAAFDFGGEIASAEREADAQFHLARGEPAQRVARAIAQRWRVELQERAQAETFDERLRAWEADRRAYEADVRQEVWQEVLPGLQKYVLGVDPKLVEIWLNLEREVGAMSEARLDMERVGRE
jgi:regulator of protease activity HflC (stomatin/prohibitin superfamily)